MKYVLFVAEAEVLPNHPGFSSLLSFGNTKCQEIERCRHHVYKIKRGLYHNDLMRLRLNSTGDGQVRVEMFDGCVKRATCSPVNDEEYTHLYKCTCPTPECLVYIFRPCRETNSFSLCSLTVFE